MAKQVTQAQIQAVISRFERKLEKLNADFVSVSVDVSYQRDHVNMSGHVWDGNDFIAFTNIYNLKQPDLPQLVRAMWADYNTRAAQAV